MITDLMAAVEEFNRLCPASVCPALDDPEVLQILASCQRAAVWAASTAYDLGAVVIPSAANRNGHRFRLIQYTDTGTDQKSGTTEPDWPTVRDSIIEDNHLRWREDGDDYDGVLWDFTTAARDGWVMKASKASPTSDVQTDALSIKSSQLFEHCQKQADRFQPVYCL